MIPDFQSMFRPLLQFLADGKEHTSQEMVSHLAKHYNLTPEEEATLLPSGTQPVFSNRIAWSRFHLKAARLLESPRRGVYMITQRGKEALAQSKPIDLKYLDQFEEHRAIKSKPKSQKQAVAIMPGADDSLTPEEHIERGYSLHREQLSVSILERVKQATPGFFERLVVELLVAMGYGGSIADAGQAVGASGDGGIDGTIKQDRLGLDVIYLQAKRWEGTVGRPEIQKFAGALQGFRARKGVFLTTGTFSAEAVNFAKAIDSKIILIDGEELAELMIDHDVGVAKLQSFELKRLDSDYFVEE